jgi:hypothetical protein
MKGRVAGVPILVKVAEEVLRGGNLSKSWITKILVITAKFL